MAASLAVTRLDIVTLLPLDRDPAPGAFSFLPELSLFVRWRLIVEKDTEPYQSGNWRERVAKMRTDALKRVTASCWLSIDPDVLVSATTLADALSWLRERRLWAGVGIWTGEGEPRGHVMQGCTLLRTEATRNYTFKPCYPKGLTTCECMRLTDDLRAAGWQYGYHPTLRAEHKGFQCH